MATYRIVDEPRPGGLSHLTVQPFWPLLALMLGGSWLGWPWLVVNGLAIGSASRRREQLWVFAGFFGSCLLILGAIGLFATGTIGTRGLRYALLPAVVWRLSAAYAVYRLQQSSFALYEYFEGRVRNGMLMVVVGYFGRGVLADQLGAGGLTTWVVLMLL